MVREQRKAKVLGIGLDSDGEARLTRGRNFELIGGTRDTHESMQEKCIRMDEKLKQRGKELEDLEVQEFLDLTAECKMNMLRPTGKQK